MTNTTTSRVVIRFGDAQEINVCLLARNHYRPVVVPHDIDAIKFMVKTEDPQATWAIAGAPPLSSGAESAGLPLAVGRNVVRFTVTAADGRTAQTRTANVFRMHPTPSWQRVTEHAPWSPRDTAGELVFAGKMWLFGGYTPALANDVWCSADGKHWTQTGNIPTGKGVDIPVALVFDDKMWVSDVAGTFFNSPDGKTWSLVTEQAPWRGRSAAGAVVFAGKMWVMGGRKDGEVFNDIWSSTDGVHWHQEVAHAAWSPRQIHNTPMVLDGKIWLLGGCVLHGVYHPFVGYNDVWCSADGRQWELVTRHAPWPGRLWSSAMTYRDRLWVMSGFRSEPISENLGDVWYSANGREWHCLDPWSPIWKARHEPSVYAFEDADWLAGGMKWMLWEGRHEASAFEFDDALWIAGGKVCSLMNDVWRLSIPGLCFVTKPVLEVYAGSLYEYQARADFNRSRQALRYRLVQGPAWLQIEAAAGVLLGMPQAVMDVPVIIEASDATGETARQTYTLHVIPLVNE